jgi:hypothetical protein
MDTPLGWMFLGIATLLSLGLAPRLAGRFYPTRPRFVTRLAAPVIFGVLAALCFAGFATPALYVVAVAGIALIVYRRRGKLAPPAAPEVVG